MKILALLALSLAFAAGAWAKPEKIRESRLPNGLVVHEYRLKNGLQLLLVPDESAPVFNFQVWFRVGSAQEKMDPRLQKTGLAHLFEHMMFRGTAKNPDQIFEQKITSAGSPDMNASTSVDRTNFYESLPKEKLELAFELESDRMNHLALDEKLFKTELGAVFGEKKSGDDKPHLMADQTLWNLAFDASPYKWSTMGTDAELNSFTVADANYFYKTYYAPNNATLVILGDIKIPQVLTLAEKYYGKIPSQEIPKREPPLEPEQTKARSKNLTHPLANSELVMVGYKIPNMLHPDLAALDVAAAVLVYGNGSWLEQELVQEGIVSHVSGSPNKARYPSLFTITIQMSPGKSSAEALKIVEAALERLREGKVTAAELERAKNQYLLAAYGSLMEQSNIGSSLGEALASSDNYLRDFEILSQVKSVSVADLQRVAKTYLVPEHSSTVIISPEKGK